MSTFFKNRQALRFVLISYGFSWICWFPIISQIQSDVFASPPPVIVLLLLGGYGPSLAAILVTFLEQGNAGLRDLFSKFKMLKAHLRWYYGALMLAPVIIGIAIFIYTTLGGELGWTNYQVFLFLPVFFLIASFFGPLGEELGWRGYLLPKLNPDNVLSSSIIVGIVWTFWHTPLFWAAEGTAISGDPVTLLAICKYLLFVCGTSCIYTYLFNSTSGNIFSAFLLHVSSNGSHMALGFLFPNMVDKKAIWDIEVYIYSLILLLTVLYHFRNRLKKS